jgi:homocysteine S-methyltransferase
MINHETIENLSEISRLATSGFQIAVDAVKTSGKNAWVAADFGPVYGPTLQECIAAWEVATNSFIAAGADLFILETFADPQEVRELASIIRGKKSDAIIIASFAISADGYTRKAIPFNSLIK